MDSLVSKQAAIDAVHKDYDAILDFKSDGRTIADSFEDIINALPSTYPRKGKWIQNDNGTWSCNQCNSWIPDEQHYYANWCLYCGADMREGDAE